MPDDAHPISLHKVIFVRSVVIAIAEHASSEYFGKPAPAPENKIDILAIDESTGIFEVSYKTTLNTDGRNVSPYLVDMECIGVFKADLNMISLDEAKRGVIITANNVLYGAIREAVAWITGRQAYGQLTLGLSILKKQNDAQVEGAAIPEK